MSPLGNAHGLLSQNKANPSSFLWLQKPYIVRPPVVSCLPLSRPIDKPSPLQPQCASISPFLTAFRLHSDVTVSKFPLNPRCNAFSSLTHWLFTVYIPLLTKSIFSLPSPVLFPSLPPSNPLSLSPSFLFHNRQSIISNCILKGYKMILSIKPFLTNQMNEHKCTTTDT